MNNGLSKFFIFATGVAIGSVVTWKLVKTKYEKIANEEIESVREYYANKDKEKLTDEAYGEDEEEPACKEDEVLEEYVSIARKYSEDVKEVVKMDEKPYVISPEEFDETDYTTESLDYYEGDGVLVDSFGDIVEDVDDMVGADFASHFGEYEPDTVYVRNDAREMDYEICRDFRSYSEVY